MSVNAGAASFYSYTKPSWAQYLVSDDGVTVWSSDDSLNLIMLLIDDSWGFSVSSLTYEDIDDLETSMIETADSLLYDSGIDLSGTWISECTVKNLGSGNYDCLYIETESLLSGDLDGIYFYTNTYLFTSDDHLFIFINAYFDVSDYGTADFEKSLKTFKITESPYYITSTAKPDESKTDPKEKTKPTITNGPTKPTVTNGPTKPNGNEGKTKKEITFSIPDITEKNGENKGLITVPAEEITEELTTGTTEATSEPVSEVSEENIDSLVSESE